ncbi:iron-containing redox enzyme family protein [Pseudomonas indica]|uniref:iron-containing redox enzyme family protein n=1 Tax=Pseudomonas indica TaxID=137658 RepID=UPI0023F7543A|nr:iron-containing redox enzyme family protein [Pseudomonas indica]MBU3056544.1 iron-containing redox enzyme family protein [Pseudomonas indica]
MTIAPRLKENIWHIHIEEATSSLFTTQGEYQVPTEDALKFMKIRPYCNGHNSIEKIARLSGLSESETTEMLAALEEISLLAKDSTEPLSIEVVRGKLIKITDIWSQELKLGYIANDLPEGNLPKTTLIGWLLEMYHYIKDFPLAIGSAIKSVEASNPDLAVLLEKYSNEEMGHEMFVLNTLENMGFSTEEVITSEPLPSTKLIGFMMRDMFEKHPLSVLLMAALVEAQEFDADNIKIFQENLEKKYKLPQAAMAPYFKHQEIDNNLGHSQLLSNNLHLFREINEPTLDAIINKLHDLKHAFELQSLEIKHYYSDLSGKYFPRQPIKYTSI